MPISISPHSLPSLDVPASAAPAGVKQGSFRNLLENAIDQVEQSRTNAESMAKGFVSGQGEELHSIALASQRAELEFDLVLQVRNKVVSAYQEIMRMQV